MQDIARGNVTNLLLHYSHIESICLWRNQRVRPVNLYISLCIKHHLIAAGLNAYIYIQYWCIDGKYRMYVARLRNGESFHSFRAEPHTFYIDVNIPILYLSWNKICKKDVIQFNNKKNNRNPIDTSIVPTRGVA
jgi:hypothetical protein